MFCSLKHFQLGTMRTVWYRPQCCNHDLHQLMCMNSKTQEGAGSGATSFGLSGYVGCRQDGDSLINFLSEEEVRRCRARQSHPAMDGGSEEKESVQANSLKSSRCSSVSQQLPCTYCVFCTMEETVVTRLPCVQQEYYLIRPFGFVLLCCIL